MILPTKYFWKFILKTHWDDRHGVHDGKSVQLGPLKFIKYHIFSKKIQSNTRI